ncbi:MAG: hypothetical protein AAGA48_40075 [Myxococcota bacterium]
MWLLASLWTTSAPAWEVRGSNGERTGDQVAAADRFIPHDPSWTDTFVSTSPQDLGMVARHAASNLRRLQGTDSPVGDVGLLSELGVTIDDVLRTLDHISRVAYEDRGAPYQRLQDPSWLAENFEALHWQPDQAAAQRRKITLSDDAIRLTKYVVYTVPGSHVRTSRFNTALYAAPRRVDGREPDIQYSLTRMDVYSGAYEDGGVAKGRAKPLVWLTRDAVNQALLQGTIQVRIPGEATRMYNVHVNNGRAWQPGTADQSKQPRYWYFREVDQIFGVEQTALRAEAAVAGDVYNLGFGKLVALEWPTEEGTELRLAILADTGGAFQPNLFQLDWLAGNFASKQAFADWVKDTPSRVRASILVWRRR